MEILLQNASELVNIYTKNCNAIFDIITLSDEHDPPKGLLDWHSESNLPECINSDLNNLHRIMENTEKICKMNLCDSGPWSWSSCNITAASQDEKLSVLL